MCRAGAFIETIKIDVIKLQPSFIRVHQRERRARDVLFRDTQCGADTLYENRFARAEWTTQQQDFSTFEPRSNLVTVVERLLWK